MVAVQVDGTSQKPVGVSSNAQVTIRNQGASDATSGAAWAVAAGAAGTPSGVTAPVAAGGAPTTTAQSATALQAQNSISSATDTRITAPGGQANTAPITITPPQQLASLDNRGTAVVTSGAACASAPCATAGATAPGAGATAQSASGAANAQGLVASNQVNTDATVAVRVRGQNYGPITVIINSITQIFNLGIGQSTSGDSVAGGGAVSSASADRRAIASSGSAQATGAVVQNRVDLRSSAEVRVNGDNYSPITMVLDLAANLVNWGVGWATSGDAQAQNGSGASASSGSATSGAASAQGLQVFNLVSMWADATVDIDGDNYAPITVDIRFKSTIDNRGLAIAQSGNVAAGAVQPAASATGQTAAPQTNTTATGSKTTSSGNSSRVVNSAIGGNAVAISNSAIARISSDQISNANGGQPITGTTITNLLRTLPSGNWNPIIEQNLAATVPLAPEAGLNSRSGNATAVGLHSDMAQSNAQLVACSDADTSCTATNSATLRAAISDSPTNPAAKDGRGSGPGTTAVSQPALVNATPVPTPSTTSSSGRSNTSNSNGARRASVPPREYSQTIVSEVAVNGHVVLVDPWGTWPGRRLPPMPDPTAQSTTRSTVDASLDYWPGMDELPLPVGIAARPALRAPVGRASGSNLAPGITQSLDGLAEPDDESLTLLAIFDVDPWATWPDLEEMPLPGQVVAAMAVADEQDETASSASVAPSEAGPTPTDLSPAAVLVAAIGAFAGLWRWRGQLMVLATTWQGLLGPRMWLSGMRRLRGQQLARAHAFLRMTLGILRLW